jgi:hypothetical protein
MMQLGFLNEPELEFCGKGCHVDIRQGLALYGPLDSDSLSTRRIRLGFVGSQQTVDGIVDWLDKCKKGLPAKTSRQPNLFPPFPGMGDNSPFKTTLEINSGMTGLLSSRDIAKITHQSSYLAIADAKDLLMSQISALVEKGRADVVIVAIPKDFVTFDDEEDNSDLTAEFEKKEQEYETRIDLRHLLKAEVMKLGRPIQLVLPSTYDENIKQKLKTQKESVKRLQDEATRAWNFHVALYYKSGGIPWRITRYSSELTSCYVGISFYKSLDANNLMTSLAQVYDERGEGVIVRGVQVRLTKEDKQPHLSIEDSYELLYAALERYRQEHRHLPARVVLHKSSSYCSAELKGFNQAVNEQKIDSVDFLVIGKSLTRLYREREYPPLRGMFFSLDDKTHLLYTRGSVDYYSTYPGMYIPRPLKFHCTQTDSTPKKLAEEILALTKLNWNNTQFDGGEPIPMRVAHQVGKVLKYIPDTGIVQPRYSFYM